MRPRAGRELGIGQVLSGLQVAELQDRSQPSTLTSQASTRPSPESATPVDVAVGRLHPVEAPAARS